MSLDNIQLPAIVLQDLFKNSLIDLNTNQPPALNTITRSIAILGNNQKQIAIIVADEKNLYLPDKTLNFLMGILNACKLTMDDVALINISKSNALTYSIIQEQLQATTLLLFGVLPGQLQLPLDFPEYQIQKYNNQLYLSAPALPLLAADKEEKTKLWNCLKQVFAIV